MIKQGAGIVVRDSDGVLYSSLMDNVENANQKFTGKIPNPDFYIYASSIEPAKKRQKTTINEKASLQVSAQPVHQEGEIRINLLTLIYDIHYSFFCGQAFGFDDMQYALNALIEEPITVAQLYSHLECCDLQLILSENGPIVTNQAETILFYDGINIYPQGTFYSQSYEEQDYYMQNNNAVFFQQAVTTNIQNNDMLSQASLQDDRFKIEGPK